MTFKKNIFFSIFWTQFSKIEAFWLDWSNVMCGIDSESDFRDACVIRIFGVQTWAFTKKNLQKMPIFHILCHFLGNFSISRKRTFLMVFTIYLSEIDQIKSVCEFWNLYEKLSIFTKKNLLEKNFIIFLTQKICSQTMCISPNLCT